MGLSLSRRISDSYSHATTDDYVERLCSSWLLPAPFLFAWRALVSLYAFLVLFIVIGWRCSHHLCVEARQSFSYFTVLGYWGAAFYYAFAAAHTASYVIYGRAWLSTWPRWMKWVHSVFYATVTVYPIIVTAVYWAILAKGAFDTQFSAWTNISQHALNAAFAISEIILPRSDPHPWINLTPLILLLALYLSLAYLTHATQGIYVYKFLNPANGNGSVAAYCIGILVATIVVFTAVHYLQWTRKWVTETRLGRTGLKPKRASVRLPPQSEVELAEMSKGFAKDKDCGV